MKRYENFCFWETPSHFIFEPPFSLPSAKVLAIVKEDGSGVVLDRPQKPPGAQKKQVQGILGVVQLPLGSALIVISKKAKLGEVDGSVIFRMDAVDIYPLRLKATNDDSKYTAESHQRCISSIKEVLATPFFYFSYSADLTNSRQRQWQSTRDKGPATSFVEAYSRFDQRFLWNASLLSGLLNSSNQEEIHPFLIPVIHGALFINRCIVQDKAFVWSLLSRRSRHMVGTRFFARGADSNGNVANFVETEQIVEFGDQLSSYVQTRGSMPMVWEQLPNLKYKPDPKVVGSRKVTEAVFRAHFQEQVAIYGKQVSVNLIDQKKAEGRMESEYRSLFTSEPVINEIHYEAFDFHKECSKMRYERLSMLMDQLSKYEMSFYLIRERGKDPQLLQDGVFRTNCIDCLDRTNVVQSLLAAKNLAIVLNKMGILPTTSVMTLEREKAFQNIYRNTWADHANLISVQYSGTGALKTDFTRTGVRSRYGMLEDGWNACVRYVKNNFSDGKRTDGMRILVGEASVPDFMLTFVSTRKAAESPEKAMLQHLPMLLKILLVLTALTLILSGHLSFSNFTTFLGFSLATGLVAVMMIQNHKDFVDFPLTIAYKRN